METVWLEWTNRLANEAADRGSGSGAVLWGWKEFAVDGMASARWVYHGPHQLRWPLKPPDRVGRTLGQAFGCWISPLRDRR
jgi:hypothetical protein